MSNTKTPYVQGTCISVNVSVSFCTALVWQLMKAYTLSVLTKLSDPESNHPIADREIVNWVNERLRKAGKKTSISGFNDPTIASGRVVIDLVDAIKPGSIKYDLVKDGETEEVCVWV